MKHLSIDEMLDFVSLTEMNSESIKFSATVNGHIRKCAKCLQLVRSFQMIYDEFSGIDTSGELKDSLPDNFLALKEKNKKPIEVAAVFDEVEEFSR